jgi:hypothetical protein
LDAARRIVGNACLGARCAHAAFVSGNGGRIKTNSTAIIEITQAKRKQSNVEKGMKILSKHDGFPSLPTTMRSIIRRDNAPKELTDAMAVSIKHAV